MNNRKPVLSYPLIVAISDNTADDYKIKTVV